ncbi:MAG TPA: ABC transporter substrate-binding protein, partial [Limnochordia bacterium]
RIAQFVPDQFLLLTAYPEYWGEKPATPNILIRFYPDATALALALRSGEIDVAWRSLNPDDLTAFANDPNFEVFRGEGGLSVRYLVFQTELPPFDDVNVRKGLALSIDREEIVERVFVGYNTPAYTMVPRGLPYSVDTFPDRNLAEARALLRRAGYSPERPLEVDLYFDSSGHYSTSEADVAALIKAQMEETGLVRVTLQPLEWATMTERRHDASMGMFLLGWYPDYLDADNYTTPFLRSPDNEWLGNRYHDDEMQALLVRAAQTVDEEERAALYRRIQVEMAEQMPIVPLWFNSLENYAVARPGISGLYLPPDMEIRLATLKKE